MNAKNVEEYPYYGKKYKGLSWLKKNKRQWDSQTPFLNTNGRSCRNLVKMEVTGKLLLLTCSYVNIFSAMQHVSHTNECPALAEM